MAAEAWEPISGGPPMSREEAPARRTLNCSQWRSEMGSQKRGLSGAVGEP